MKVICRKCGTDLTRIHRGITSRILTFFTDPFIKFRKFECLNCGWKGLRRR